MTARDLVVKQLGALPVLGEYLERLGVRERVDALAPVRAGARLTNGEVVVALVANRLTAPRPLYDIVHWAETWAVEELLGIAPAALNDDRLGRCLDDLAAVHDRLRGELTVQAVAAFGLETRTLRWDVTSVVVTGAYPEEEQAVGYPHVRYGYGGNGRKQVRYVQVTSDDGAVPVWDQVVDGNTADVATVADTLAALQEHAQCAEFVLIGDSKLLSTANRQALLAAEVGYIAPLARTPELDAACLALGSAQWQPLGYVSARDEGRPAAERTSYQGAETTAEVVGPAGRSVTLRRLFVISSEERAACRRNRARQRERAERELTRVSQQVGTRWYPTVERAQAKMATLLEQRHLAELYEVTVEEASAGRPTVRWAVRPEALERAEALDGYYVLETTRTRAAAEASALLAEWKGQWRPEQRHRAAKGPLCVRPVFVSSTRRLVGLITIVGIALLVFSLLEREARRALAEGEKVPALLAAHVAARPTGDNLLKALREVALVTVTVAGHRRALVPELSPLVRTLLRLVAVPETVYTRIGT